MNEQNENALEMLEVLDAFFTELVQLTKTVPDTVEQSNDASLFDGKSLDEWIDEALQLLAGHLVAGQNPHQVTAAQLDTYSKAEFNALLENSGNPSHGLPWVQFGMGVGNLTVVGGNMHLNMPHVPVIWTNWSMQFIPEQSISCEPNSTTLIYLEHDNGTFGYHASTTELEETEDRLFLGTAISNETVFTSIDIRQLIRIGSTVIKPEHFN